MKCFGKLTFFSCITYVISITYMCVNIIFLWSPLELGKLMVGCSFSSLPSRVQSYVFRNVMFYSRFCGFFQNFSLTGTMVALLDTENSQCRTRLEHHINSARNKGSSHSGFVALFLEVHRCLEFIFIRTFQIRSNHRLQWLQNNSKQWMDHQGCNIFLTVLLEFNK